MYLDLLGDKASEAKHPHRRTKKWSRPERELTTKERHREEKRQQRLMEDKSFQGYPPGPQPYRAVFALMDRSMPPEKFEGDKESYLNVIRTDCKCHVFFDPELNCYRVEGQHEINVQEAASRLRNWYLRLSRKPEPACLCLLYQPEEDVVINFIGLPDGFIPVDWNVPDTTKAKYRQLETVIAGDQIDSSLTIQVMMANSEPKRQQQQQNLIDLDLAPVQPPANINDTRAAHDNSVNKRNAKVMETAMYLGLESLRLTDWEITMDVGFGRFYLLDYPRRDRIPTEYLANNIFTHPHLTAKVAPCIGTDYNHVNGLFAYLCAHGVEFTDSPRTTYTIHAMQQPTLRPRATPGGYNAREAAAAAAAAAAHANLEPWRTTVTIENTTSDGHAGLWTCVTDSQTIIECATACLKFPYSWETRLKCARRLVSDFDTPHGEFVKFLRVANTTEKRLILLRVPDFEPHEVCQSTKWCYAWKEYIVEIEKQELWEVRDMHSPKAQRGSNTLPLDLSHMAPHCVCYSVNLYKDEWRNRFAQNLNLHVGESPSWLPYDFIRGPKEESMDKLQQDAYTFASILSETVPFYCEAENHL
ncbi:hypothetical protein DM01DRAFT_1334225 [Hesseltinella vesiculosa]|uniref:DUF7905 domain-containing protein n=1 Tax=Hesseltinella vesiculosa TaxID=101127 RepID=A0A1X2GN27_9FUNG|nr:hypothetical protein DM01DRAFT_1334225 [Hesseltinella vesiculosa]